MPRVYGEKLLRALEESQSDSLGVRLGRVCVKANLPAVYLAKTFEVSTTTIHNWFRGSQGVNGHHAKAIEVFIDLVNHDMEAGRLPAASLKAAKFYIQDMIGVVI